MNMVANIQKYSFKEETCHQEIYCDRFDHLYKQYPQEMLEKLFEYNIRYQVCNWNFFEKFLHQEDKKKNLRYQITLKTMKLQPLNKKQIDQRLSGHKSLTKEKERLNSRIFDNICLWIMTMSEKSSLKIVI